jgi:hypothetical protein
VVNGVVTDIPTTDFSLVNGQLQALVNGQLLALVNGQLLAIVNGQLQPLVNGAGVAVESVRQLANGQLQALVNETYIPIANGQLQALVNGQLLAMVNGQLMAIVNGEVTFAAFSNGQLQALVNGQLQPLVNGQLQAIVNGQLQALVNSQAPVNNSYSIVNGQLQAIVNNQTWAYANGQLLALVNGQLQPLVNNFDVSGTNNNAKTSVLVDEDDINLQSGDIGGMFSMNMITGLDAGTQSLVPGAFVHENFEVTYGLGQVQILQAPLIAKANDTSKVYGDTNPDFTISYSGFAYGETESNVTPPSATTTAVDNSNTGTYPITLGGGSSSNYTFAIYEDGTLTVGKKDLNVTADNISKLRGSINPPLTISYDGLVDDTEDSICIPYIIPPSPKVLDQNLRITTYSDVKLNNGTTILNASPGEAITLTGDRITVYNDTTNYCPGCVTQLYIGMANAAGLGNVFTNCYDVSLYNLTGPGNSITDTFAISFNAPTTPGVYYITQVSSWQYNCYDNGEGNPGNNRNNAIAVVVVDYPDFPNEKITASTTADASSPPGDYPIKLQSCNSDNPNYNVILHDGILTVSDSLVSFRRINPGLSSANSIRKGSDGDLYPNPASLMVRLKLKNDEQIKSEIQLFDVVGRIYKTPVKKINKGLYEVDVSSLSKGVYLIRINSSGGLKTFRFIKD